MHSYTEEEIALYVNGDMAGEDQQQFETVLQRDRSLQENVQEYRQVQASLRTKLAPDAQDKALANTLHSMNDEFFGHSEGKIRPVGTYIKWALAAAGLALILVVNLFHPWRQNDLYKEYSSLQMVAAEERGEHMDTLLQQAVNAFNGQRFTAASEDLKRAHKKEPDNAMIEFYYGVSLVETGDQSTARKLLQHTYDGSSVFKYDAAYFMALSYLKEHQYDDCRGWLKNIPSGAGRYKQAQSLLEHLP